MRMSLQQEVRAVANDADVTLRDARPEDLDAIVRLYASDPWLSLPQVSPASIDADAARAPYLDRLQRGSVAAG